MPTFRAYLLNAEGRITWGDWLEADTAEEALEKAKGLCHEGVPTVEVWQGATKIGEDHCPPKPQAKPRRRLPDFRKAMRGLRA